MLKLAKTSLLAIAIMATSVVASDILATVNGKNITKQEADQVIKLMTKNQNASFSKLDVAQQNRLKDELIQKILITEQAKKEGVDKSEKFKRIMEEYKDNVMLQVWMEKQFDNILVSDSEAKEFYENNKDKFKQPETATARHILIKVKEDASSEEDAEAKKKAEVVLKELKALKGDALKAKFIELAKAKSEGPSAPQGGELAPFKKEQMVPEFSKAAWVLKEGAITMEPVKTQFGYHIIYLDKKNISPVPTYDQIKANIIARLKQKQFAMKVAGITKELKSKAKIVDMTAEANVTKK